MILKIKSLNNIALICLVTATVGFFMLSVAFAQADATKNAQVDTSNAGLVVKVAPGELLPISVKLSNFADFNLTFNFEYLCIFFQNQYS